MTTARDIVKEALRKIQVLGTGQQLSAEDAERGFNSLNQMIALESTDSYNIYNETVETFSLTPAKQSYTFGTTGQDFNTSRPLSITAAYVSGGGDIDYNLTKYDVNQYSRITDKDITGISDIYYYDGNFPVPRIYLYPVPASVNTITLYMQKALDQFDSLDSNFIFPPEYEAFLIYNLAVFIAGEYQREPLPQVIKTAQRARDRIENQNTKNNNFVSVLDVPSAESQTTDFTIYERF